MIKKIIVAVCLFFALISFSQEGTSSPYSFYGVGDVRFKGTAENRSMGGLSIFRDSTHINLQNPASFSNLKFTSFAIGGGTKTTRIASYNTEDKTKTTTIDYLAVGLPLGKFGASFGLIPYSSVGYKIQNRDDNALILKKYSGSGGINKVFFGLAYNISQTLSIGFNADYNFGKITTNTYEFNDGVQYGTREINGSNIRGGSITTGLQYQSKFKGKVQMFGGLTFTPESKLNLNNTRNISTVQFSNTATDIVVDNQEVSVPNTTIKLPSKITFGIGFGEVRKWQVGSEIVWQKNSNLGNRFNDINNAVFENATKYTVGGFYIPKYNSFTSYFERIVYRAGFNYQNIGLVINNQSIKEQCFTFGLGLPLGGTFSSVNIGYEFGKRGTRQAGLIQENYSNITIGLSFNDRWFVKRKYD